VHVVREDGPELVVGDLADEGCVEAQRRCSRHAVRGRPAADLAPRAHRRIEVVCLLLAQQSHRALGESALVEERIIAGRDDVDDRIADRHDVEDRGGHGARG